MTDIEREEKDALYSKFKRDIIKQASRPFPQWYKDLLVEEGS